MKQIEIKIEIENIVWNKYEQILVIEVEIEVEVEVEEGIILRL